MGCEDTTKWKYLLPNDYEIKRVNNTTVILGKKVNNETTTVIDGVTVGVEEYVSKFSYSDNYIAVMCLIPIDNNIDIKYYIIDSKNNNRYGPYPDEETFNKVKDKLVSEKLGEWIDTIEKPKDAVLN
ncbi:MAG: hypothetical protein HFG48_00510 [Bacilli bacterium]|nr:hypothetical protein [Bacilli bacterium]